MSEPKHPTRIDVSAAVTDPRFGEWICGPECPRDEQPAPLDVPPTGRTVHNVLQRRREIT